LSKQGVFASGIVLSACSLFWVWKGHRITQKAYRLAAFLVTSALILVMCGLWLQTTTSGEVAEQHILNRFFHDTEISSINSLFSMKAVITASAGRMDEIWVEAWKRICENPMIGSGFKQTFAGRVSSHNAVLDMLVGMGLFGCIPFVWGSLLCLRWGIRGCFRSESELKQLALLCCMVYALSYIGASMGETFRWWVSSPLLYGFSLGILYGEAMDQGKQNERVFRRRPMTDLRARPSTARATPC
jgi:O-antigen ligase